MSFICKYDHLSVMHSLVSYTLTIQLYTYWSVIHPLLGYTSTGQVGTLWSVIHSPLSFNPLVSCAFPAHYAPSVLQCIHWSVYATTGQLYTHLSVMTHRSDIHTLLGYSHAVCLCTHWSVMHSLVTYCFLFVILIVYMLLLMYYCHIFMLC